jgi:hypothetical protein
MPFAVRIPVEAAALASTQCIPPGFHQLDVEPRLSLPSSGLSTFVESPRLRSTRSLTHPLGEREVPSRVVAALGSFSERTTG